MKLIIKLEELGMLALSICALYYFRAAWWWYPVLLLGLDISMLGYLMGNKPGAVAYDLFHHKGIAIFVFLCGVYFQNWYLQIAGIILFGHSSMDRFFGYGLKTFEGFKFTHLGKIGN